MTAFPNRSLSLMEDIARGSTNEILLTRKGYLLATRESERAELILRQLQTTMEDSSIQYGYMTK